MADATGRRRLVAAAMTVVGVGLGGAALVLVGRRIATQWDEVGVALAHAQPAWMVIAGGLAAAGMGAMAVNWRKVLNATGADLPRDQVIARYFVGEIGKYLPGGLWPVLGRGELAVRAGVPRPIAYPSVALSLAYLYLADLAVVTLLTPAAAAGDVPYAPVFALLPLGLVALHPRLTGPVLRRIKAPVVPTWRESIALITRYTLCWALIGTATWAVARALGTNPPLDDVMWAAGLSWVVGFVIVPVPGGVGLREAVFVAAAPAALSPALAATVAVAARLLFVAVDVAGFALGSTRMRRTVGAP